MEDRLESLAGLRDEVQRIAAAMNEAMIQKYNTGIETRGFPNRGRHSYEDAGNTEEGTEAHAHMSRPRSHHMSWR